MDTIVETIAEALEANRFNKKSVDAIRLANASPDLLAALERMLAAHDADVEMGSLIALGNEQAAEQARIAIAKAQQ